LDFALSKIDAVNAFLTQNVGESFSYDQCVEQMREILKS
jgi:flagellum-specific ATP synthase